MRLTCFALALLALAACSSSGLIRGPDIPVQGADGQPTVIEDHSADEALGIAVTAACVAGVVAIGVVTANPGAVGGLGLCN